MCKDPADRPTRDVCPFPSCIEDVGLARLRVADALAPAARCVLVFFAEVQTAHHAEASEPGAGAGAEAAEPFPSCQFCIVKRGIWRICER